MPQRVAIDAHGAADAMCLEDINVPLPLPGEVQVEHSAVGLNEMVIYQRSSAIPLSMPDPLVEATGREIALGAGVSEVSMGDRVVDVGLLRACSSLRNAQAARLVPIPRRGVG